MTLIDCTKPLGMENGQIRDDQITASGIYSSYYWQSNGRLNFKVATRRRGAWASGPLDLNQRLQVNMQQFIFITGISTQGRQDHFEYVYLRHTRFLLATTKYISIVLKLGQFLK